MNAKIFLDESGDLGWKFNSPYRNGGSSRFLTLSYLVIAEQDQALPSRLVRKFKKNWDIPPHREKKGTKLSFEQQEYVIEKSRLFIQKASYAHLGAITVKKEKVAYHIRKDANKLYNYMIKLALIDLIHLFDEVELVRDDRTIKLVSGKSLEDYIQTELWFAKRAKTVFTDSPTNSNVSLPIQYIDWISYMVWSRFEDGNADAFNKLTRILTNQKLFF